MLQTLCLPQVQAFFPFTWDHELQVIDLRLLSRELFPARFFRRARNCTGVGELSCLLPSVEFVFLRHTLNPARKLSPLSCITLPARSGVYSRLQSGRGYDPDFLTFGQVSRSVCSRVSPSICFPLTKPIATFPSFTRFFLSLRFSLTRG